MAVTAGGTPYVESSDLVANYPAVSLALAEHIDDLPAAILQVVRATDTTNRSTTSTSFVDVTGMSVTITPQKSTSAIIILVSAVGSSSGGSTSSLTNFQITDSSNNTISGAQGMLLGAVNNTMNHQVCISLIGYATPATLSAVTYKVRFRSESTGSTSSMRNADNTGQLYAIEVSA
jgi:hypothetical protein